MTMRFFATPAGRRGGLLRRAGARRPRGHDGHLGRGRGSHLHPSRRRAPGRLRRRARGLAPDLRQRPQRASVRTTDAVHARASCWRSHSVHEHYSVPGEEVPRRRCRQQRLCARRPGLAPALPPRLRRPGNVRRRRLRHAALTPYRAPAWLPGGHAQTIWPVAAKRAARLPARTLGNARRRFHRRRLAGGMPRSGRPAGGALPRARRQFASHYAGALMQALADRGWSGAVPHFRGCSGEPNRLPRAYHSGDSTRSTGCCAACAPVPAADDIRRLASRSAATPC
jgi:hypothetical protein